MITIPITVSKIKNKYFGFIDSKLYDNTFLSSDFLLNNKNKTSYIFYDAETISGLIGMWQCNAINHLSSHVVLTSNISFFGSNPKTSEILEKLNKISEIKGIADIVITQKERITINGITQIKIIKKAHKRTPGPCLFV